MESPLVSQMGTLVAVARIVSDWRQYKLVSSDDHCFYIWCNIFLGQWYVDAQ